MGTLYNTTLRSFALNINACGDIGDEVGVVLGDALRYHHPVMAGSEAQPSLTAMPEPFTWIRWKHDSLHAAHYRWW